MKRHYSRISDLMKQGEWDALSFIVAERFDVDVDAGWLRVTLKKCRKWTNWSDASWLGYIKQRLQFPTGDHSAPDIHWSCDLHFGFIHIVETEEHRELLSAPEPDAEEPMETLARSRIGDCPFARIHPIDRVARRIVAEWWLGRDDQWQPIGMK